MLLLRTKAAQKLTEQQRSTKGPDVTFGSPIKIEQI